jgi:hypothetical protein
MRPDKEKVVDEVWDDERIRGFLDKSPMGEQANADYSVLLHAYRSMRADDFRRFISMFVAAGRDLDATDNHGQTLLQMLQLHRKATPFRQILEQHGAAS